VIGLIGLWVFVMQTATAKNPFFHRDLAKDGNFVGTTIFGFFVGALLFLHQRAVAVLHAGACWAIRRSRAASPACRAAWAR